MPPKNTRKVVVPVGPSIAYVPLTKGQHALIDSWHANAVEQYCWHASWSKSRKEFRAASSFRISKVKTFRVSLHRAVAGNTSYAVDHKNGNPLDNRESNLRTCSSSENNRNRRRVINRTGFKGVSKCGSKYAVIVRIPGKSTKYSKSLGTYATAEEAAVAYDRWAVENFGKFAATNF